MQNGNEADNCCIIPSNSSHGSTPQINLKSFERHVMNIMNLFLREFFHAMGPPNVATTKAKSIERMS